MKRQPMTLLVAVVLQILFEVFAVASVLRSPSEIPVAFLRFLMIAILAYFTLRNKLWARVLLVGLIYATAIADVVVLFAFPNTDHTGKTALWVMFAVEFTIAILGSIPARKAIVRVQQKSDTTSN